MAKKANGSKSIEQYEHKDKQRLNNPPVGLVTEKTDSDYGQVRKKYEYDPHLDPQLQWAGKAEHTSFEVPVVSLHVHERIDPKTIIDSVKKDVQQPSQMSLFEQFEKPYREAVEFYKHKEGWTNRLIAGDSLLVMNSLLEKEGMAGKVQMVYFDPPYGIKYGSNFQPFVNKRDVKDGSDEDLTQEPEMINGTKDTMKEIEDKLIDTSNVRLYRLSDMRSQRPPASFPVEFEGKSYIPTKGYWKTGEDGFKNLIKSNRIESSGNTLNNIRFLDDFPAGSCKTKIDDNPSIMIHNFSKKKMRFDLLLYRILIIP